MRREKNLLLTEEKEASGKIRLSINFLGEIGFFLFKPEKNESRRSETGEIKNVNQLEKQFISFFFQLLATVFYILSPCAKNLEKSVFVRPSRVTGGRSKTWRVPG